MRERVSTFAYGGDSFQITAVSIEMQLYDGTIKQLCPNLQECGHGLSWLRPEYSLSRRAYYCVPSRRERVQGIESRDCRKLVNR